MSDLTEFVIIFLVQLLCTIVCLTCLIHWTYIHYHNHDSHFLRRLGLGIILPQYLAITAYTITSLVLVIEIIEHLTKHNIASIGNDFNVHDMYNMRDGPSEDIHSFVATSCHQLGKLFNYIIMFLRLKQMLKDSIFEYSNKVYITMTGLIIFLTLIAISVYIIPLYPHSHKRSVAWKIAMILWAISDMTYYAFVSYLFLAKLHEITNTYRAFVITATKQTALSSATASAESDQDDNINNNNNNNDSQQSTRIDRVVSVSSYSKQIDEKRKIYEILSHTMKIYTILTVIIVLSSAIVYFIIYVFGLVLPLEAIAFMFVSVDATINGLCLLLFFENARIFYHNLLSKCLKFCLCQQ